MSAREGLVETLSHHVDESGGLFCSCQPTDDEGRRDPLPRRWEDHLADVILRAWLPGALADERVVEAATWALRDPNATTPRHDMEPLSHWDARAALTAAVTALTEEDERG